MKRKKKLEKKKCKIENVNNFSLHLKIEMIFFIIFHQMGILNIKSMWVYIPGLYWLSKKKLTSHRLWISITLVNLIVSYRDSKCLEISHFCLTYNTLIVQINNTICHIFISFLPFLTFFCFSFHVFLCNLSLINNHINNICDLRGMFGECFLFFCFLNLYLSVLKNCF